MASVDIASLSQDKKALALPYFNLAKIERTLGEFSQARENFEKALNNIQNNPPDNHNRPGVVADFKIHLYTTAIVQPNLLWSMQIS